jgi:DNA-binding NarL/FixJ family response regulator
LLPPRSRRDGGDSHAVEAMSHPPRVLLGALDPIVSVGIARALEEGGATVVDQADEADMLVARAAESLPDAVVVGPRPSGLSARLRVAAPAATVVVWRGDGEVIEVLSPGTSAPRLVPAPAAERLHAELFGRGTSEGGTCPAT